jgi:pyruvate formate lyase activating enzyme
VTAGEICEEPRAEFYAHMDAANVDLKGFTERFYHDVCAGHLQPVLDTLVYLKHQTNVWFEITTLLIPGENDSDAELDAETKWIVDNLGPDVPVHFTAFHPDFRMLDKPHTPPETLTRARKIAQANGIRYAYTGNVHDSTGGSMRPQRTYFAAANESPSPVQSATCAARHTGHFGMKTHTPSDNAPAAISQPLRRFVPDEG